MGAVNSLAASKKQGVLDGEMLTEATRGGHFVIEKKIESSHKSQLLHIISSHDETQRITPVTLNVLSCDVCGKECTAKCLLIRHKVSHSNYRPYLCEICSKCFKRSYELRNHMKIHSEEKKYKCDICGAAFIQSPHLTLHRRRHLRDYRFWCEVCDKGFHTNVELQGHTNTHHSGNEYVCSVWQIVPNQTHLQKT
jgi:hypothetical protein